MVSRVAPRMCLAVVSLAGLACSSSRESCPGSCEGSHPWTGINLASGSPTIAAIETLASPPTSSGCGQVYWWTSLAWSKEQVCPPQPIDASASSAGCAMRYPCQPSYQDLGEGCTKVTIEMAVSHCQVTVVSITGERQSFDVSLSQPTTPYRCHTADGTCVWAAPTFTLPAFINVEFAPADASPAGINEPGAVD